MIYGVGFMAVLLDARPMVVTSGSMMPAISQGDALIVRPASIGDIEAGDIISFQNFGKQNLTTHRVIGVSMISGQPWYQTKGDNNRAARVCSRAVLMLSFLAACMIYGVGFMAVLLDARPMVVTSGSMMPALDISTSPSSAIVSFSAMAPGDTVTAPVTVSNAGSMQMRYAIRSTTTEDFLAAQLDLTIKIGVTTCNNGGFSFDGTSIYGAGDAGNTGGLNLVGDPSQGAQAGDRTLDAATNEILCVQVSLPTSTGNSYQGLTTTATLEFLAEQTAKKDNIRTARLKTRAALPVCFVERILSLSSRPFLFVSGCLRAARLAWLSPAWLNLD